MRYLFFQVLEYVGMPNINLLDEQVLSSISELNHLLTSNIEIYGLWYLPYSSPLTPSSLHFPPSATIEELFSNCCSVAARESLGTAQMNQSLMRPLFTLMGETLGDLVDSLEDSIRGCFAEAGGPAFDKILTRVWEFYM
jgi:hypothetical protein